jgi:hypothetical protein
MMIDRLQSKWFPARNQEFVIREGVKTQRQGGPGKLVLSVGSTGFILKENPEGES